MGNCKDCMYWGKVYINQIDGVCDFINTIYAENKDTGFYIGVKVIDDQGLETKLHTAPNFGCVNFEKKEQ